MKTNRPIDERSYKKWKRIIESNEAEEAESKDIDRYFEDVKKSQGFEVGYYPHINPKRTGFCSRFTRIYDSSHTRENLIDDRLLCYSNLAICFYNMREDTCFDHVKLIMATQSGVKRENFHITFEAFSSTSTGEWVAVTFQTQIFEPHPSKPYRRFEIIFVRIKPESQNSQQDHLSEFDDHKAQIYQHRLRQLIETYTIDSQLDSQYNLALYLSQYALVCYNLFKLKGLVAEHDIKLLEVVELMKHVAEETTYHITFKAPLRAKSVRKKFFTFKAEICMPILFPTTSIQLKSGPEVITELGAPELGPLAEPEPSLGDGVGEPPLDVIPLVKSERENLEPLGEGLSALSPLEPSEPPDAELSEFEPPPPRDDVNSYAKLPKCENIPPPPLPPSPAAS